MKKNQKKSRKVRIKKTMETIKSLINKLKSEAQYKRFMNHIKMRASLKKEFEEVKKREC